MRLVEHLRGRPEARVLDFASGSGRNADVLRQAGLTVVEVDDRRAASRTPFEGVAPGFAAALSTHGLLHGTTERIAALVLQIGSLLTEDGVLCATFGSVHDVRFARGRRIDAFTFAPEEGDEHGVPHGFFDRGRLCVLLERGFVIESLEEYAVDAVAGSWAHATRPLSGAVHWFAVAHRFHTRL